jgi:hypothetical protein
MAVFYRLLGVIFLALAAAMAFYYGVMGTSPDVWISGNDTRVINISKQNGLMLAGFAFIGGVLLLVTGEVLCAKEAERNEHQRNPRST